MTVSSAYVAKFVVLVTGVSLVNSNYEVGPIRYLEENVMRCQIGKCNIDLEESVG